MTVNMTLASKLAILPDDSQRLRQATIGNRVFEALRQAVVQLQLRPGNPLSEADIGRQLGVSRQPVREAFIKLAEAGLVEIRPQRGTFVRLISVREVRNARFLREAIEVAIARKAAVEATHEQIAVLKEIIAKQRVVAHKADNVAFLRLDEAFHQALARSADCDDAWRVLQGFKAQMDRVRYLSLPDATPLETIIEQHERIVAGVEQGSSETAEEAMRHHLSEILISLPKLALARAEFFTD
jgi:DNA-binding GntR family transcriptional regulator